jgi:hypothetical protein
MYTDERPFATFLGLAIRGNARILRSSPQNVVRRWEDKFGYPPTMDATLRCLVLLILPLLAVRRSTRKPDPQGAGRSPGVTWLPSGRLRDFRSVGPIGPDKILS